VPLVHEEEGKVYVKVGETLHPMDPDHYIDWIYLLTDKGAQRKILHPGQQPEVIFLISEDEVVLDVDRPLHQTWPLAGRTRLTVESKAICEPPNEGFSLCIRVRA
jgi:desulfoferrodoxin